MSPDIEREPIHYRITVDRHCFRVTMSYLGIQHRMSFPRYVYERSSQEEKRAIRNEWHEEIRHWSMRMRKGFYGLREFKFPHPRLPLLSRDVC